MSVEGENDTASAPLDDADAMAGGNDLSPEFRVVITDGRRRGIRLERIYWRVLAEIADRRGIRRSRLIADVLEQHGQDSDNAASILRCFALESTERERTELLGRTTPGYAIGLLQQAPVAAFAINRQKRLQQVNPEFLQVLRMLAGNTGQPIHADRVQLTLEAPIEDLFRQLVDARFVHTNYLIEIDALQRRGRARLVTVPQAPTQLLVGYIVS